VVVIDNLDIDPEFVAVDEPQTLYVWGDQHSSFDTLEYIGGPPTYCA
jgi:hypothetical protein